MTVPCVEECVLALPMDVNEGDDNVSIHYSEILLKQVNPVFNDEVCVAIRSSPTLSRGGMLFGHFRYAYRRVHKSQLTIMGIFTGG